VSWLEIEVVREASGRPTLQFHGRAAQIAARLGVARAALSITHTAEPGHGQRGARRRAITPAFSAILKASTAPFSKGSKVPSRKEIQWSQLRVGALVLAAMAVLIGLIFLMSGSTGGLFAQAAHSPLLL
jgi:hypothetical protein